MTLNDMKIDDCGIIIKLSGCPEFRKRLYSLGITKDSVFRVKRTTIQRSVFEIEMKSGTRIALRRGETKKIKVELCSRYE